MTTTTARASVDIVVDTLETSGGADAASLAPGAVGEIVVVGEGEEEERKFLSQ
jgi:hypothetical protein